MEREAVDSALKKLKEWINVVEITTDSSASVTKMLGMLFYVFTILAYLLPIAADKHPRVLHSIDIWHKAKLLKEVLKNVRFVQNHIYVIIICNMHAQCSNVQVMNKADNCCNSMIVQLLFLFLLWIHIQLCYSNYYNLQKERLLYCMCCTNL